MQVVQNNNGNTKQEFESSVSPKGQITLPIELRKKLGVQTKDRVVIRLEEDGIKIMPTRSKVDTLFGSVTPLTKPMTLDEMRKVYRGEIVEEYVRNDH